MKTLLLMRHAKSDWYAEYGSDHERPLNERGVQSARVIGLALSARDLASDLVISSTAVRARTTAELAAEAGSWGASIVLDGRLYDAAARDVIAVVAAAPAVARLILVGHQPTWSTVVFELTGETVDMKTASVAVIQAPITGWKELSAGPAHLVDVLYPSSFLD